MGPGDSPAAINAFVCRREPGPARPGPLSGMPFTVKDNIAVAGWPLSLGVFADAPISDRSAPAVARLLDAGAVLIGKTNLPPYGGGIETVNDVFGRTNNPYDLTRTAGGSSGGEAAAIASGESRFGLGTDSGGSVRLPAHFCGLAALKPTAGRVPIDGVYDDLGPVGPISDPRTQVGVLARSVADVALVLWIIEDRPGFDAPVPLRVAVLTDDGVCPPDAATAAVVADAAAALADAGAVVSAAMPPAGGPALTGEVWQSYADGALTYDLLRRWDAYRDAMSRFGQSFDVMLSPVFPTAAPPHGEIAAAMDRTSYTNPHNLTGWAAATVRAGTSADGMPIGVQLAAPPWHDAAALAAASIVESALGGYRAP